MITSETTASGGTPTSEVVGGPSSRTDPPMRG